MMISIHVSLVKQLTWKNYEKETAKPSEKE